ncbi:hypothetical protein CF326_g8212 [Tilletia indica]|nr:hypothetical protein CF326_g8212 [Tilletia indica]
MGQRSSSARSTMRRTRSAKARSSSLSRSSTLSDASESAGDSDSASQASAMDYSGYASDTGSLASNSTMSSMALSQDGDATQDDTWQPPSTFIALANYQAIAGCPSSSLHPTSLSKHKTRSGRKWIRKATVPTRQLYQWFESQVSCLYVLYLSNADGQALT